MTPQTTCSLAEHWIYASLDGELSESLEVQLERHLDACPACRERLAEAQLEQQLLSAELTGLGGVFDHLLEDRLTADDIIRVAREEEVPRSRVPLKIAALVLFAVGLVIAGLVLNEAGQSGHLDVAEMTWNQNITIRDHGGVQSQLTGSGESTILTGQDITIPFGSSANLELHDGTKVRVYGGSRFELALQGKRPEFYLRYGRAHFDVQKAPTDDLGEPTFVVTTPAVVASVLGTRFDVVHDSDRLYSRVDVEEGRVRVEQRRSDLAAIEITAGESAKAFKPARMQLTRDHDAGKWVWKRKKHGQWVMQVETLAVAQEPVVENNEETREREEVDRVPVKGTSKSSNNARFDLPVFGPDDEDE